MADTTIGGMSSSSTALSTSLVETEEAGPVGRQRTIAQIVAAAFADGVSAVLSGVSVVGLNIKAFASHTGNLLTFRDSSNTLMTIFTKQGWLDIGAPVTLQNIYSLVVKITGASAGVAYFVDSSENVIASFADSLATAPSSGTSAFFITQTARLYSAPVSPAQITANQHDYAPTAGMNQRWNSDASRNVTGMVAGTSGEHRLITNVGSQNIVLKNQDAGSSAANRWLATSGADVTLAPDNAKVVWYDGTTQRWRILV